MRASFLATEALENVRTGTARAGVLATVVFVVVMAAVMFDLLSVLLISSKAEEFRASGGAIRVLAAPKSVDPAACERLAATDGVARSGAVEERDPVTVDAMPGLKVPHYSLSAGVAALLGIDVIDRPGFYLASDLAAKWGLQSGSVVATDAGRIELLGTFDYDETDGRDPRFANAFIDIAALTSASECWAEIWPTAGSNYDGILQAAVSSDAVLTADIQVFAFNPGVRVGADGYREFKDRPSRYVLAAVMTITFVVAAAGSLRRRLEMSSNLHAGATRFDLVMVTVLEVLISLAVVAVSATAIVAWSLRMLLPSAAGQLFPAYVSIILLGMLGGLLGAVAPIAFQSEEQLFRTFKRRA